MKPAKASSRHEVVIPEETASVPKVKKGNHVASELENGKATLEDLEDLLKEHIGTVKLREGFLEMRKKCNEEFIE